MPTTRDPYLTYELVLVSGDGGEDGLREDVGPVELLLYVDDGPGGALRPDD